MPDLETRDVIELAKLISPTINLKEIRPGVTKKSLEFSVDGWCRVVIAARAAGISPSRFVRIVVQNHINDHQVMPEFLPPARMKLSTTAFDNYVGIPKEFLEKLQP